MKLLTKLYQDYRKQQKDKGYLTTCSEAEYAEVMKHSAPLLVRLAIEIEKEGRKK